MNDQYEIDFRQLFLIVRRQLPVIIISTLAALLIAGAYLSVTKPLYTANALLFLDKRTNEKTRDSSSLAQGGFDNQAIESEVGVLSSGRVAENAIRILKKNDYLPDEKGTEQQLIERAQKGLKVARKGETYLLSVQYTASSPDEAADFANAFADAYVEDQIGALSDTTTRTADWLRDKIEELRADSIEAAARAAEYRGKLNARTQKELNGDDASSDDFSIVELNTIEKEAETYKNLHDSYVEKLRTASTQESFPITETRIITRALPPTNKSHPKTMLILAASIILGGGLGLLLAMVRDGFDKTLRRAGQVKSTINVPFLGFLPRLISNGRSVFSTNKNDVSNKAKLELHCANETVQVIRNAIDKKSNDNRIKIIGLASIYPDISQGILAAKVTELLSKSGKIALIKASSGQNGTHVSYGLSGDNISIIDMSGEITPTNVEQAINNLKSEFKYILIDLPPMVAKADFYSFAHMTDGMVILGKWGVTLPNTLNFYMNENGVDKNDVIGVVLEGTNLTKMQRHFGHKFNL